MLALPVAPSLCSRSATVSVVRSVLRSSGRRREKMRWLTPISLRLALPTGLPRTFEVRSGLPRGLKPPALDDRTATPASLPACWCEPDQISMRHA